MAELLLEILSEEVPARMQERGAADLEKLVADGLREAGLGFDGTHAYSTPRRLVLVVDGLPIQQPDLREERKGPRVGAPDKAVEGFLRSVGLSSLDQCERRPTNKGEVWVAVIERTGQPTAEILPSLLADRIRSLGWPKSMRWGANRIRWVRPLQRILAVFDGAPLAGSLDLGGDSLSFGNTTVGHRFMAPKTITAASFAEYARALDAACVMVVPQARRDRIASGLADAAAAEGLQVRADPGLLAEVAGLVEWPVVRLGEIDARFMELPAEVLTASMRAHQKYFALETPDGRLAPRFGVVANIETADGGAAVVKGNERVLRARLADAEFFWTQDRRVPLGDRIAQLGGMIFHARLGTLDEKVDRTQALAVDLCGHVAGADRDRVRSAARLAKADLSTGMVGEFPELQGVMGRYYALAAGEHAEVAQAIAEHYAPQGPDDMCPTAPVSVCVALADRVDTLVGFWIIDEKPTGSRDPYALRRAALGVIRLVLENGLRIPLRKALVEAHALFKPGVRQAAPDAEAVADSLLAFFADRLKVHLRAEGVRHDLVSAVFALGGEDDLVRLLARVDGLRAFIASEDGANLLTAYRRASNIVSIEEKRDGVGYGGAADPDVLREVEEKRLWEVLSQASASVRTNLRSEDFPGAMRALASLRGPVDEFFDAVTVNCDEAELRVNRLRLLTAIRDVMNEVADFSCIEG